MASSRFVNKIFAELKEANHSPILGYEDSPLLTLKDAVEKVNSQTLHFEEYVATAQNKCKKDSSLLEPDESAAVYLYSMPTPFFSLLNEALRAENRDELKPWFAFLKLFMTAIKKLDSVKKTVWLGVAGDVGSLFVENVEHIWWSINSCSMALDVVEKYLGETDTLFAIDVSQGKDISAFSASPAEREIVLMPGTRVRAESKVFNFIDRLFVVYLEEVNSQRYV